MYAQSQSLMGLGELAQLFGYTRDHLAYLCRTGQIPATRNGRSWQTTHEGVERYKNNTSEVQKQRWEEMSKKQRGEERRILEFRPKNNYRPQRYALNYILAYAEPRPSVFASILSSGTLLAFDSFQTAVKLVIGRPLQGLLWTANKGAYLVYHAFNTPLDGLLLPYWKLATVPIHGLYPQFKDQYSLYGLVKASRGAHLAFTSALSVFIAFNFLFSGANFIGSAAGTVAEPRAFIAQSVLVRDYLQIEAPVQAKVAGAMIASGIEGETKSFKTFLTFWRQALDCSRFFCYNISTR